MALRLQSQTTFSKHIENVVHHKRISYLEAVVAYVEEIGIEPEKVNKLLSKSLKDKIECEALDLNMFPNRKKGTPLPFLKNEKSEE